MSCLNDKITETNRSIREPRQRVLIRAQMYSDQRPQHDIIIRDVSLHGIGGVTLTIPPIEDEKVAILLPDGQIGAGWISWINGMSFGLKVHQALDLQSLIANLERTNGLVCTASHWEVESPHRLVTPRMNASQLRRV